MKLTKRPLVRRTDPTEQGEYIPGFQAQAMLVEALGVDVLAAARILMEAAAGGQLPARCIRRKDEFYSHRHVPDDPAVITRQLRAPHEQSPAAVLPEDWTAILRQIDEIEAESADRAAALTSLARLAPMHDTGRWSFHFWRTDVLGNTQHTTMEDVDFQRSEVVSMCAASSAAVRRGRPPRYNWPEFFTEATRLLRERGGLSEEWIQADLERDMEFWCETTWHRTPNAVSIRTHVRKALLLFDNSGQ